LERLDGEMKGYMFDGEMAQKYGVDEAIMLHNLAFWQAKNEANEKHFYDGHYWTYNSKSAFAKLFPFWSEKQIKRILKSLKEQGAIIVGQYNDDPFNRTNWYSVIDSAALPNHTDRPGHMDQSGETKRPADNIDTDSNLTDSKQIPPYAPQGNSQNKDIEELYALYPTRDGNNGNRSTGKCSKDKERIKKHLKTKPKDELRRIIELYVADCKKSGAYLKNFSTFLNNLPDPESFSASGKESDERDWYWPGEE
jgi:hypothetical protein